MLRANLGSRREIVYPTLFHTRIKQQNNQHVTSPSQTTILLHSSTQPHRPGVAARSKRYPATLETTTTPTHTHTRSHAHVLQCFCFDSRVVENENIARMYSCGELSNLRFVTVGSADCRLTFRCQHWERKECSAKRERDLLTNTSANENVAERTFEREPIDKVSRQFSLSSRGRQISLHSCKGKPVGQFFATLLENRFTETALWVCVCVRGIFIGNGTSLSRHSVQGVSLINKIHIRSNRGNIFTWKTIAKWITTQPSFKVDTIAHDVTVVCVRKFILAKQGNSLPPPLD